ncbi:MAG: hypothetical protein RMI91_03570 [Gemmatales bacterium]|nr:hypothetical protein [Gemmatales bacterium]MDW7993711.1 hypothetical protein [Gemmatales bacterium]
MRLTQYLAALAVLAIAIILVLAPQPALACPGCKEAVAAQDIESDSDVYNPSQLAKAYNYSIYFMLSMPYLLTASFGLACYWMVHRQRHRDHTSAQKWRASTEPLIVSTAEMSSLSAS